MEELIRRTVGPHITLEVVTAAGLWPTLIDPSQLENALLNLCINARDAMPEGGRITIETANKWLDDRAATRARSAARPISVALRHRHRHRHDAGRHRPRIRSLLHHQAARPGHRPRALDGLWLRAPVRRTGAHLFRSGHAAPRCASICRAITAVRRRRSTRTTPAASTHAPTGKTVLIVDDEPSVRMLVTEVLEELGYAPIEASDGPTGLQDPGIGGSGRSAHHRRRPARRHQRPSDWPMPRASRGRNSKSCSSPATRRMRSSATDSSHRACGC